MRDKVKTKEQLTNELAELRKKISEMEAKESLLRNKGERLDLVIKASQDGLWDWNIKTGSESWSPQYKELLGYQDNEIEPSFEKWESMIHPDDRQFVKDLMRNYLDKPRSDSLKGEFRIKTKSGDYRWYASRGQGVWDAEGKAIRMVGSMRDVTEIKKIEEELKKSYENLEEKILQRTAELKEANEKLNETREYLENILRTSVDGIIIGDSEGKIAAVNKAVEKILDCSGNQLVGKHTSEMEFHEEVNQISGKELIDRLFGEGTISGVERTLKKPDGTAVVVEMNIALLKDNEGNLTGSVASIRDITDRKRAEETLKRSEEKYHNLIEHANDAIVSINSTGMIIGFNKKAEEMFGYSREEMLGKPSYLLAGQQYREKQKKTLKQFTETGTSSFIENRIAEGKGIRKDGKEFDAEFSYYILDVHGELIGTALIRNITERKKAEQNLIDYQKNLKSLTSQITLAEEQERRRFAEYLHDEIGQQLFATQLQLELLKGSSLSSAKNTKTLDNAINNIKNVMANSRSLTFELSSPILHELGFEKALEWLAEQAHEKYDIRITFKDDNQEKPLDDDVKIFLYQAVRELLTNVAKHAQTKNASLSVKKDNSNIRICVKDNGVGFNASNKHSSDAKLEGFGLFRIGERIEQLGGQLEIESQPNHGTQMTLLVPLSSSI